MDTTSAAERDPRPAWRDRDRRGLRRPHPIRAIASEGNAVTWGASPSRCRTPPARLPTSPSGSIGDRGRGALPSW